MRWSGIISFGLYITAHVFGSDNKNLYNIEYELDDDYSDSDNYSVSLSPTPIELIANRLQDGWAKSDDANESKTKYLRATKENPKIDEQPKKPNIIFYLADDLGFNEWNSALSDTPNLHKLAAEGTVMDRTITQPVCGPTRYAIMTGRDTHLGNIDNGKIPLGNLTLPKVFSEAGYVTGFFGKDGLYPQNAKFDARYTFRTHEDAWAGFPLYVDADGSLEYIQINKDASKRKCNQMSLQEYLNVKYVSDNAGATQGKKYSINCEYAPYMFIHKRNKFILDNAGKQPFFLYYADPRPHVLKWRNLEKWPRHCPVLDYGKYRRQRWSWAPKPYNRKKWNFNERGFMASIWGIDEDIGILMDVLRKTGQENNTLIIFSSDNGPQHMHDIPFDLYGLRGKKRDTWENGIRNQAIIWYPDHIPAGKVNHCPWKLQYLLSSLSSVVGSNYVSEGTLDVSPMWFDESKCSDVYKDFNFIDVNYCEEELPECKWAHYDLRALPNKMLKFVNSGDGPQLFEVIGDEREANDLAKGECYTNYLRETYNYSV